MLGIHLVDSEKLAMGWCLTTTWSDGSKGYYRHVERVPSHYLMCMWGGIDARVDKRICPLNDQLGA